MVVAAVVNILALVVELAADGDVGVYPTGRPSALWVVIALASPFAVVRRLLRHRRVTT